MPAAKSSGICLISIHAPREGSDAYKIFRFGLVTSISIHAPREGSDAPSAVNKDPVLLISIHAPREGSDYGPLHSAALHSLFQSTLPVKGATKNFLGALSL